MKTRLKCIIKSFSALEPYTEYTFIVGACTGAGCANSSMVSGRTLEDKPIGEALMES